MNFLIPYANLCLDPQCILDMSQSKLGGIQTFLRFIGHSFLQSNRCLKYFGGPEGSQKFLRQKGPQKFIPSNRPRNLCGSLSQKFLWILVSEIPADESLSQKFLPDESFSQKFLPVSRCQRNFCGSWKLYFLSCVFANVLQTSETTVINAYRQETYNFSNILP